MNDLKIFEHPMFGELRTIVIDGEMYFCGIDVAKSLGYSNPNNAITRHCRHSLKRGVGVHTSDKVDGTPVYQQIEMTFINAGDVYRLTARSKLEGAEKFESWIFDEIVPSVMQTGAYQVPGTLPAYNRPTMAEVRFMELQARSMERMNCSPYEVAGMIARTSKAYGLVVTPELANKVDPQLSLFASADVPSLTA